MECAGRLNSAAGDRRGDLHRFEHGHAYVAAEDCEEALVLGVCSSNDEALVSSLMQMHEPTEARPRLVSDESGTRVRSLRRPAA